MIEFLLKLNANGIKLSVSDYYRIKLVLSTNNRWSIFRLKETLRSLLVKKHEHNDIFDNCFIEHFGQELDILNTSIDVQKAFAELQGIKSPENKNINKNDERNLLKSKKNKHEKILEFQSYYRKNRKYKEISYLIICVLVLLLLIIIYETANLSPIKQFFIKSINRLAEVSQHFSPLIIILFLVVVLLIFLSKRIIISMFKSRLRHISSFSGRREYILSIPLPPICNESFLDEFADNIGFFMSEDFDVLIDIEQSIDKTVRQGNPQTIYRLRREIRQVLILEEKCSSSEFIFDIPNELKKGFTKRGIPVKSGFFYEFPKFFKLEDGITYLLEDIDKDRNGYLVFIFGKLQDVNINEHRIILEDLSNWPYIFWLNTCPTEKWDHNSELISSYIPVYPATLKGLEKVADLISKETYDRKKEKININSTCNSIEFELQDCLPWACACALFQPMDFGVAEEMRKQFFHYLEKEDIQRMIELVGTNCTNAGFIFSGNNTNKLINILRSRWPEKETIWREWFDNLLNIYKPDENSLSFFNWRLLKALNLIQIDKVKARTGAKLLSGLQNSPIEEYAKQKVNNFNFEYDNSNNILLRSNERDLWTKWTIAKFVLQQNIIVAIKKIIKYIFFKLKLKCNVKIYQQTFNEIKAFILSLKRYLEKYKLSSFNLYNKLIQKRTKSTEVQKLEPKKQKVKSHLNINDLPKKSFHFTKFKRVIFMRTGCYIKDIDLNRLDYDNFMALLLKQIDPPLNGSYNIFHKIFSKKSSEKSKRNIYQLSPKLYKIKTIPKNVDIIYYSSSKRAIQTAKLIQKQNSKIAKIDGSLKKYLDEVKFSKSIVSEAEFKHLGGLKGCRDLILARWFQGLNKETFDDSLKRLKKLDEFIRKLPHKSILLITHGWYLRLIYLFYSKKELTLENLLNAPILNYGQFIEFELENSDVLASYEKVGTSIEN